MRVEQAKAGLVGLVVVVGNIWRSMHVCVHLRCPRMREARLSSRASTTACKAPKPRKRDLKDHRVHHLNECRWKLSRWVFLDQMGPGLETFTRLDSHKGYTMLLYQSNPTYFTGPFNPLLWVILNASTVEQNVSQLIQCGCLLLLVNEVHVHVCSAFISADLSSMSCHFMQLHSCPCLLWCQFTSCKFIVFYSDWRAFAHKSSDAIADVLQGNLRTIS